MGLLKKAQESRGADSLMRSLRTKEDMENLINRLKSSADKKQKELKVEGKIEFPKTRADIIKFGKVFSDPHDSTATDFFKKYELKSPYNPLTLNLTWRDFFPFKIGTYIKYRRNLKLYQKFHDRYLHITMELKKGGKILFWVNEMEDGFIYNEGQYVFDPEMRYPITDMLGNEHSGYDFYEGFPLPFRHSFPIAEVQKSIREGLAGDEVSEVEYATNPLTLLRFILSDIIKKLFASDQILPMLQIMFWLVIGSLVLGVINLVMNVITVIKVVHVSNVIDIVGENLQTLVTALQGLKK